MIIIYGIPNCNTIKKTIDWFTKNNIDFQFHDYKKQGISKAQLASWSKQKGWEVLLNKKGTTWRNLPVEIKDSITSQQSAIALMIEQPSMIKRPVITQKENVMVIGFDESQYENIFLIS